MRLPVTSSSAARASSVLDNCQAPAQTLPCEKSELEGRSISDVSKVTQGVRLQPLGWRAYHEGSSLVARHVSPSRRGQDDRRQLLRQQPGSGQYTADLTRQGIDDGWASNATIRLTGQITQKNKISWYFDKSNRERDHWGASATTPPEASARQTLPLEFTETLKFQSTLSNRLLLELGWGQYHQDYTELYQPEVCAPSNEVDPSDPRSCQRSTIYRIADQVSSKNCCAFSQETYHFATLTDFSAKLSFVTGSHNLSGGWNGSRGPRRYIENHTGDLTMRFGATTVNADATGFGPNRVTLLLPVDQLDGITMDNGFWVNDKWTVKRATITMGLRYDWFIGYVGESAITPNRWLEAHTFSEPEYVRTVPNWKDVSPRIGVAYDLFGNGKTALKASFSRYVDAQATGFAQARNPVNTLSNSINLGWSDHNKDFTIFNADGSVQDVDFNSNAPIDPNTGARQNELDPKPANSTFGTLVTSTTRVDQNLESGYSRRGYTWEFDLGVQHEVLPGVSAGLTYFRRLLGGNGIVTDNVNVGPEHYSGPYCVTGPTDPRLPENGGQQFCGIYQPLPSFYSITTDNYSTFRQTYLDQVGDTDTRTIAMASISASVPGSVTARSSRAGRPSTAPSAIPATTSCSATRRRSSVRSRGWKRATRAKWHRSCPTSSSSDRTTCRGISGSRQPTSERRVRVSRQTGRSLKRSRKPTGGPFQRRQAPMLPTPTRRLT